MPYKVEIADSALKSLTGLPSKERERIRGMIRTLADNPRPHGALKMRGPRNLYRIRAGNYRVLYAVEDAVLKVLVVAVGHRREVYRD